MEDCGLMFDALVRAHQLPVLADFARRHPSLQIVINHAAKPDIMAGEIEKWSADLAILSAMPNICCKLSGLVTEASAHWTIEDIAPYISHVLTSFGPDRVIWGSDWPVMLLHADYAGWMQAAEQLLAQLDARERAGIFGLNAARVYRINQGRNISSEAI